MSSLQFLTYLILKNTASLKSIHGHSKSSKLVPLDSLLSFPISVL